MDDFEQLTTLLLNTERDRLERLEKRLNDVHRRSQEIAEILPEAVRALPNQADFIEALQTSVDSCVKESLQQDPRQFVKALFPIEGPLLRRLTDDAIKPIKKSLQTQQSQLNYFDQLLNEFKQEDINQLSQLQKNLHTQLNNIEKSLDNFEKAQANQHTQLNQFIQSLNTFEQAQNNQQTQLNQLTDLKKRIENPQQRAKEVAKILPAAIRLATQQANEENLLRKQASSPEQISSQNPVSSPMPVSSPSPNTVESSSQNDNSELTESLQMPVEACIEQSLKQNVHLFVDALFPLIGPMIRKSISSSFKELMQRINAMLEQSILSRKGIAWRLQAWRTGQSFAEIVLKNTLAYRVEQVFLIHRTSGLLMSHAHLDEVDVGDSDAVSAMFTAIQDFIRDSFSTSKEEELDSVEIGKYTVWIERGPHAVLACVIRGDAPRSSFRGHMQNLLENMHACYGGILEDFSGDTESLESCQPWLEDILVSEEKKPEETQQSRWITPQLFLVLGVILFAMFLWGYFYFEYQHRLTNYIDALHDTPGIVVVSTKEQDGKLVIHGMRDPLAEDPQDIAHRFELSEEEVIFKGTAYQDLDTQFAEQRLRQKLKPPKTVEMSMEGTILRLSGHADQAWIDKLNQNVDLMTGVTEVVTDKLVDTEAQFQTYLKTLNETPGIMVVSSGIENGQHFVTGIRDPLAEEPDQIAKRMQIYDLAMRWTPYPDLTPQFVEQRVRQWLDPPSTVQLHLEENTLYLSGHAPQEWIEKVINHAYSVIGINKLEIDKLVNTDHFLLVQAQRELTPPDSVTLTVHDKILRITGYVDSATFETLQQRLQTFQNTQKELASIDTSELIDTKRKIRNIVKRIENIRIYFYRGSTEFILGQETALQNLLKDFQQLLILSQELNWSVRLQVTGNTDSTGSETYNKQLSQRRAQMMVDWLQFQGIKKHDLTMNFPAKIRFGDTQSTPRYRNVSFRVIRQVKG